MEWIPIFLGVFIALAIYANFISKYNERSDKLKRAEIKTDADIKREKENPETNTQQQPKSRFCPLCHSELGNKDSLYAEMYEGEIRPRVIIHGCRNCYIPSGKKTNFEVKNAQEEN